MSEPILDQRRHLVIASDSAEIRSDVTAVLDPKAYTVHGVRAGADVLPLVKELVPALVVCDQQIGAMGGMATCLELRLEESAGRLPHIPFLLLLDRRADVFLARRSQADGFVLKPLDPIRLRRAVTALLAGERYEDASYRPVTAPTA